MLGLDATTALIALGIVAVGIVLFGALRGLYTPRVVPLLLRLWHGRSPAESAQTSNDDDQRKAA